MYKKILFYLDQLFLDKEQNKFVKNNNKYKKKNEIKKFTRKKKILVQIDNKNFNLLLIKLLKYKFFKNIQFTGIYTMSLNPYNNFFFARRLFIKLKIKFIIIYFLINGQIFMHLSG